MSEVKALSAEELENERHYAKRAHGCPGGHAPIARYLATIDAAQARAADLERQATMNCNAANLAYDLWNIVQLVKPEMVGFEEGYVDTVKEKARKVLEEHQDILREQFNSERLHIRSRIEELEQKLDAALAEGAIAVEALSDLKKSAFAVRHDNYIGTHFDRFTKSIAKAEQALASAPQSAAWLAEVEAMRKALENLKAAMLQDMEDGIAPVQEGLAVMRIGEIDTALALRVQQPSTQAEEEEPTCEKT